jgi:hypothetical protein
MRLCHSSRHIRREYHGYSIECRHWQTSEFLRSDISIVDIGGGAINEHLQLTIPIWIGLLAWQLQVYADAAIVDGE